VPPSSSISTAVVAVADRDDNLRGQGLVVGVEGVDDGRAPL